MKRIYTIIVVMIIALGNTFAQDSIPQVPTDSTSGWKYAFSPEGRKNWKGEYTLRLELLSGTELLWSDLSFAKAEAMEALLDITPGSVSVLGLMNDKENRVQLMIDEDILKGEYFGCHPCINTSSLRLKTDDLLHKIIPAMGHEPRMVTIENPEA